jgi:hypothetical protein
MSKAFENFVNSVQSSLNERIISVTGEWAVAVDYLITTYLKKKWNIVDDDEVYDLIDDVDLIAKDLSAEIKAEGAKGVKVTNVEFVETDSSNWSHAGVYYNVTLTGQPSEIGKVFGPNKLILDLDTENLEDQ